MVRGRVSIRAGISFGRNGGKTKTFAKLRSTLTYTFYSKDAAKSRIQRIYFYTLFISMAFVSGDDGVVVGVAGCCC